MENKYEVIYDDDDGDDAYYMELRRQILLLTAEDDKDENEDFHKQAKHSKSIVDPRSYFSNRSYNYFPWCEGDNIAPTWLLNLWRRSGNGTGVFIPQIVEYRRRYKPSGKINNEKTRIYRAKNQLQC